MEKEIEMTADIMEKQQQMLRVKGLYKSFGNTEVLKGVSFDVKKGEVVAILGSSGSGKTTLLRCLNFLEMPDLGTIVVNEDMLFQDNQKIGTEEELRKKRLNFGLVFQSFNLFPQYNVKNNVRLPLELQIQDQAKSLKIQMNQKNSKLPIMEKIKARKQVANSIKKYKKEELAKIDDVVMGLLSQVGLAERAEFYPYQLSGGQQQRVAIARALALSPNILCFDEPTSALDPELTGEVLKVIKNLKGKDRTMIIVTHEMDFARNVADKIIFMANGVIEEQNSAKEFFDNPQSPIVQAFLQKSKEEY